MSKQDHAAPDGTREHSHAALDEVEDVFAQIRDRGGRVTAVTRRVVRTVMDDPEHHYRPGDFVHADDAADGVAPSTIYRTVDRLVDYGILTRSQFGDGTARFSLAAQKIHEHLACDRCGRVIDTSPHLLDEVAEKVRAEHGFLIRIGAVALHGTCQECRRLATRGD